jgi:O-antigen/teichoic acid export membrane protein
MSNNNSNKIGFLGNSSIYMFSSVFSFAVSILVLPVYTRYLSPSDFGIVVLFMMFGTLLIGFLSISLHFATYRYYFKYKDNLEKFRILNSTNMVFLLLIFLLSGGIIYFSSEWFSSILFDNLLTNRLIQLSFFSGCMEYLVLYMTTLLTAEIRSIPFTVITVSRIILNTALSFYFIFQYSLTYMARINAMLITQGVIVLCLIMLTKNMFSSRISLDSLKKSLKLTFPIIPQQLIGMIHGSFDKTMLNKFTGLGSVGFYSFGQRFSLVLKAIMDSVDKVWNPFFLNKAHENSKKSKQEIVKRFYELSFFYMISGLCLIYFSEEMIKLLTTKEFYPSMYVVPVYVYYYLFAIIGTLTMNQISYSEKMIYILPASIVSVIINISLNIILIPKFGAIGAAGATAIATLFSQMIMLYYGMKLFPLPLGIMKLVRLYLIVMGLTIFAYPLMAMELNIFFKIIIKFGIVSSFIILGIRLHYVSMKSINYQINKLKLWIT